jgi:hypothetical protein
MFIYVDLSINQDNVMGYLELDLLCSDLLSVSTEPYSICHISMSTRDRNGLKDIENREIDAMSVNRNELQSNQMIIQGVPQQV